MVKWSNPGKGVAPPLHLNVVAIENGAFWSPLTMVANFTYKYCYVRDTNLTSFICTHLDVHMICK